MWDGAGEGGMRSYLVSQLKSKKGHSKLFTIFFWGVFSLM